MNISIENNIYQDPLTGLPNFFKFIETDVRLLFAGAGAVMVFDLAKFNEINELYSREVGDLFLIGFSKSLSSVLESFMQALFFRTHGDEFTVILPGLSIVKAEELSEEIKSHYKNSMEMMGFNNAEVHTLIFDYSDDITTIDQFYRTMFLKSFGEFKNKDSRFSEQPLVERIVSNFTNRIKETLTLLNDAYSLALTDDISTLPNQRAAKIYLKSLVKKSSEPVRKFSLLFIDGDNLKRYNQINYSAGNDMIKALSRVISCSLRKNDRIFRWLSGDEFLVVLEDVDNEAEERLAERVRSAVEEQTRDWSYPITVSIGVASFPEDGKGIEEILDKAEKANVIAKASGKNRVVQWRDIR